jgi:hypothetical protein
MMMRRFAPPSANFWTPVAIGSHFVNPRNSAAYRQTMGCYNRHELLVKLGWCRKECVRGYRPAARNGVSKYPA